MTEQLIAALNRRQLLTRVMPACSLACLCGGWVEADDAAEPDPPSNGGQHKFEVEFDQKTSVLRQVTQQNRALIGFIKTLQSELKEEELIRLLEVYSANLGRQVGKRQAENSPDTSFQSFVATFRPPNYDKALTLEITETERGLNLVWEYDTALFDAQTIERMQQSFHTLLGGLRQQQTSPVSRLPILDTTEQLALVKDAAFDPVSSTDSRTLVDLFEEQVDKWPEKTAVAFGPEKLTYTTLNRQANQLAHYLLDHGVKPGNLVGLCLERSADLVVSIIGILKTGAAYVPLDPAYPQDRILFMLDDAQVNTVVTQSGFSGMVQGNRHLVLIDSDKTSRKAISLVRTGGML